MTRLIGVWLAGCALCVTPVVADEDVYDGPTAIRPLTVVPHSAPPNTLCDFEHQCYPKKGGPMVPAPVAPPVEAAKPDAPLPEVPDEPIVATWRGCIGPGPADLRAVARPPRTGGGDGELSGAVGGAGWRELRRGRTFDLARVAPG